MDISTYLLEENSKIPNNPDLPLLIYKNVFTGNPEVNFKEAFKENGWSGIWINGVYDYHHYHSRSHEVLGVINGSAILILGGPEGEEFNLKKGDMVVLPAGSGHCRKESSVDFRVIGAYPEGQESYDICTKDDDPIEKKENIKKVKIPSKDPVYGDHGPLLNHWKRSGTRN